MLRCTWSRLPAFASVLCGLTLRVWVVYMVTQQYCFFGAPSLFSPCSPLVFWCTPAVWFPGAFGLEHKLRRAFMWNPGSNTGWIIQHQCFIHIFVLAILSSMSTLSIWPFFCFRCRKTMVTVWICYGTWMMISSWKYNMFNFRSSRSQTFIIQLLLIEYQAVYLRAQDADVFYCAAILLKH